jgi:hypothetical protein
MPFRHCGAQSLGRFTDGKREGRIPVYLPEMFHRIPAPAADMKAV